MSDVTRLDERMDPRSAYAAFCRRLANELEALPPLGSRRESLTRRVSVPAEDPPVNVIPFRRKSQRKVALLQ